jgi:hypothetical protein
VFFYYGSKRAVARYYDRPRFPVVVEPFAGAAAYSMHYIGVADEVLLYEKDVRVVELWHRLLAMEPDEVLALVSELPEPGSRTSDFLYMTAATSNAIAMCKQMKVTDRMPDAIHSMLRQIATGGDHSLLSVAKRKVTVHHGDYREAPDIEATWFIDPPYQITDEAASAKDERRARFARSVRTHTQFPQGMGYAPGCKATDVDYFELGEWCQARRGQVIVAEQSGADWLPFWPLSRGNRDSTGNLTSEVEWTSDGQRQQLLF